MSSEQEKLLRAMAESQQSVAMLLKNQARTHRWRFFFFALLCVPGIALYCMILWSIADDKLISDTKYVGLVDASGVVGQHIQSDRVISGLKKAFSDKKVETVLLRLNSPGGSPVEGKLIHDAMLRLRSEHPDKKMLVLGTESLASAAYLIAVGADEILVQPATIAGSIGVIMSGYDLSELAARVGIKRRILTAGQNKAGLDPLMPAEPDDIEKMQSVLDKIHLQFIADVKKGRGDRLPADAQLFDGNYWTGEEAVELGLVDGIGSVDSLMAGRFYNHELRYFTQEMSIMDKFNSKMDTLKEWVFPASIWSL
ncbi:S49 family peptidase [Kistimonas scapharcae]